MKSVLYNEMKDFVLPIIKIDSHQAKLGNDQDVCVLKFETTDKAVAKDMVSFIESGYKFILDADYTPSKNKNGNFDIFVEVQRDEKLPENIITLSRDIEQVTGILPWQFSFYKDDITHRLTQENLQNQIPTTPNEYEFLTDEKVDEDIGKFFESSNINNITRKGKNLLLNKLFSKHIFEILSIDKSISHSVYRIDETSETQSSYLSNWLGHNFRVIKQDDAFKISKDDKTIVLKAKDF